MNTEDETMCFLRQGGLPQGRWKLAGGGTGCPLAGEDAAQADQDHCTHPTNEVWYPDKRIVNCLHGGRHRGPQYRNTHVPAQTFAQLPSDKLIDGCSKQACAVLTCKPDQHAISKKAVLMSVILD